MTLLSRFARAIIGLQPSKEVSDFDLEYLLWLCSLYVEIRSVPGHIAEVGVAGGRNTVLFSKLIELSGDSRVRQYIGFDTFDGFVNRDLSRDTFLVSGSEGWKKHSRSEVLERCRVNGVETLVELFEGDASETVPKVLASHHGRKFSPGKARFALLYVDCNAFSPALASMRAFAPYLMPKALIAIDEKHQGGETEAILTFAAENGLTVEKPGAMQVPMLLRWPS